MTHAAPFTLALTVSVPVGARQQWIACPQLGSLFSEEPIQSCDELRAVLTAHGRIVSRILSAPEATRYPRFRIFGRSKETGALVCGVEWVRSAETSRLVMSGCMWTACEWEHA